MYQIVYKRRLGALHLNVRETHCKDCNVVVHPCRIVIGRFIRCELDVSDMHRMETRRTVEQRDLAAGARCSGVFRALEGVGRHKTLRGQVVPPATYKRLVELAHTPQPLLFSVFCNLANLA